MTVWKEIAPFFNKNEYSTLLLDLRGHGKSDKKADISFEKAAKDINEILKKEKIKNTILVANTESHNIVTIKKFIKRILKDFNEIIFVDMDQVREIILEKSKYSQKNIEKYNYFQIKYYFYNLVNKQ